MSNDKDFKVKNGIQPTVYQEGLGTIATGSVTVGYDLSVAAYDSKFLLVSSSESRPLTLAISSDGTKLYVAGQTGDAIDQWTLSTAFDVSTGTYDSVTFSYAATAGTNVQGMFFKPDGTKFYLTDDQNNTVYAYTMSAAWDLSTASHDTGDDFSVVAQTSANTNGIAFNSTGTKFLTIGSPSGVKTIFQYNLSTAWDITSASYSSNSLNLSGQTGGDASGIQFNSDDTEFYVTSGTADDIFQYNMTSAGDLSTASYSNVSFSTAPETSYLSAMYFGDSGSKLYVCSFSNDTIFQYTTGSTLTINTLDLSTGNAFQITPTSNIQVGLSNPAASGTVSQATLLLGAEDPTGVSSAFSTDLYTGTGSTQTITNGIDLAGEGGMVWIKTRSHTAGHSLQDTERGAGNMLSSNGTWASTSRPDTLTSFNSNGFSLGADTVGYVNYSSSYTYVSWSFKKQTKFFDVVTYTGDGVAGREISHGLNNEVGMIIVKQTNTAAGWYVLHKDSGLLLLEDTSAQFSDAITDGFFGDGSTLIRPTSSVFTLGDNVNVNGSGNTYVAYVFAHDTSATSAIKCGSYTGNGSSTGPEIDLGFEPQWLLIKKATGGAQSWAMYDTKRGIASGGDDALLFADTNGDELGSYASLSVTSTGFKLDATHDWVNTSGETYVYMAIANPSASTITYDSSIQFGGGTAPDSPAIGETDVLTFSTRDGGTTYQAAQAIDGAV